MVPSGEGGGALWGGGCGSYKLLDVTKAQACIIQHGENSQYLGITKWKLTFKNCIKIKH